VVTAAAWARRQKAALRIVHSAPPRRQLAGFWRAEAKVADAAYRRAGDALRQLAVSVDPTRELEISTGLLTGKASKELVRAAAEFRCDLLVAGAHGEHDALTRQVSIGSTASKLLSATEVPLLLVRRGSSGDSNVVIAAVDLTEVSAAVLRWASVGAAGAPLHVLHAYNVPFAERLEAYGLVEAAIDVYAQDEHERRDNALTMLIEASGAGNVHRHVERGDAATLLFAQIRRLNATLVVLGKHAPRVRRAPSTTYGSVCRYAAVFSPTDVLVVPSASSTATT
jgi:nucleotide-binding universal stress UspA family protein